MAITVTQIESQVAIPALAGGFVYDVVADLNLAAATADDPLTPLFTKMGLPSSAKAVGVTLSNGDLSKDNGGTNALVPVVVGGQKLQYRLGTTGVIGADDPSDGAAPTSIKLRFVVIG